MHPACHRDRGHRRDPPWGRPSAGHRCRPDGFRRHPGRRARDRGHRHPDETDANRWPRSRSSASSRGSDGACREGRRCRLGGASGCRTDRDAPRQLRGADRRRGGCSGDAAACPCPERERTGCYPGAGRRAYAGRESARSRHRDGGRASRDAGRGSRRGVPRVRPSRQRDADAARRHHDRGSRAWLPVRPGRDGVRGAVLRGGEPPRPAVPSARGRQALQLVRSAGPRVRPGWSLPAWVPPSGRAFWPPERPGSRRRRRMLRGRDARRGLQGWRTDRERIRPSLQVSQGVPCW